MIYAFKFVIYNKMKSGIYNIGTGKTSSVLKIAKILEYKISGKNTISSKSFNMKNYIKKINFLG